MANGLTGDYDALVEVSVAAVNRLLATVHQKGSPQEKGASPKFLHSFTARVGDLPKLSQFELAEAFLQEYFGANVVDTTNITQDVLIALQEHVRDAQEAARKIERDLSEVEVSPSASGVFMEAVGQLGRLFIVRGTAKIQVGTPTLSLSPGSTSEVTVHAQIRAQYAPEPGTVALPAPIHGEVQAAFTAKYNPSGSTGKPALDVKPSDDDNKITFIPAPGTLTASEAKQIAREVRRFLRTKFEPMSAELPNDFPFEQFKSLPVFSVPSSTQAFALPLHLNGQQDGAALSSVTNLFLQTGDAFAIAISGDFISVMMHDALKPIEDFSIPPQPIKGPFGVTLGHFAANVTNATLECEADAFVLTVTGSAKIWGWAVFDKTYNVTIWQKLTLELNTTTQKVSLVPVGDVQMSGVPSKWKSKVKSEIKGASNTALDAASNTIQLKVEERRTGFNNALKSFAPANAIYTSVEIEPNGVILRGHLSVSPRPQPPAVVDIAVTGGGTALTAFKSWIPAGTVGDYEWSWVTKDPGKIPWWGTEHVVNTPHSFIFQPPKQLGPQRRFDLQRVCLRVEGARFKSESGMEPVSSGDTCSVGGPPLPNMPAWWVNLMLPIWGPDPGPEDILSNGIVAHINARSEARPADTGITSIIHFASDRAAPLPVVSDALLGSRLRDAEIPVILVLPQGSFDQTRASLERTLGAFAAELRGPLLVTEDYQGNWTKAFKAPAGSATYLMSGTGELTWKRMGPLRARTLTAALEQHGSTGRPYPSRMLQLGVRTGEPAPDVVFQDGAVQNQAARGQRADELLLGRLSGQRVLLLFWKSWSAPCVTELRRLQRAHDAASDEETAIVAVGGGEQPQRVREIAQEHHLRFPMVADPKSVLARRYGVACWPTTVWINEHKLIQRVHYGVTPAARRETRVKVTGLGS